MKTEKHQLEGRVTSAEIERDDACFALEKEQAVLSNAEETLAILKTENHQLEERVSSVETEQDSARLALEKN